MYDAEVAYQDHLLGRLLQIIDSSYHRDHTAVVIVADHGEMLGEHRLMGHGFGVHEELVRVPLMVRLPGRSQGIRVAEPVTTAQIFHTLLDLAQVSAQEQLEQKGIQIESSSLRRFESSKPSSDVFSEAYPPENVIKIIEKFNPALLQEFSSQSIYRAAYDPALQKLVKIGGDGHLLFNLVEDPYESHPLQYDGGQRKHPLAVSLDLFVESLRLRQPENWSRGKVAISDPKVLQRLQKLGYLE
jgi:uncharacterized sulfatase